MAIPERFSSSSKGGPPAKKARQVNDENDHRKYFDTQAEYDSWLLKSEKAREEELFDRSEAYDKKQNRQQILQQLEKRRASQKTDSTDSDSSDEEEEIGEKKRKNGKKEGNAAALNLEDVFGNDSSSSSSDTSSSASDESDSDSDAPSDEKPGSQEITPPELERKRADTKEKILPVRLTRSQLAKIVHAPFFSNVVKGAFVLVRSGPVKEMGSDMILCEVLDVLETDKVYSVENATTNKTLKVRNGDHENNYRLCFLSNAPCEDFEFDEYRRRATATDTLPFEDDIDKKREQITKAMNHHYTNEDINFMIKERQRHETPRENRISKKTDLLGKLRLAQEKNDYHEEMSIRQELAKLDGNVEEPKVLTSRPKSEMLASIMMREHPNKMRFNPAIQSQTRIAPSVVEDDSCFTRKRNRVKVVTGKSGV